MTIISGGPARGVWFAMAAVACAALASAWLPAAGRAQAGSPESVPMEFVEALVPWGPGPGDRPPDVLVGRLPEATAGALPLPPGSRVIGSLAQRRYTTAAIAVPQEPAEARTIWEEHVLAAGWTRRDMPRRGGFESTRSPGLQFCNGDASLMLMIGEARRGAGSYVRVMHDRGGMYSICRERGREPPRRPGDSLIPSLAPPPGAIVRGGGSGGGGGEWHARARMETELAPARIREHYGDQLRREGWRPLEAVTAEGIAVETYRVTDEEGVGWLGVLLVFATQDGDERLVTLTVAQPEGR